MIIAYQLFFALLFLFLSSHVHFVSSTLCSYAVGVFSTAYYLQDYAVSLC